MKRLILTLAGIAILLSAAAQDVVPYPAIPGMTTSNAYSVTVSNLPVWVEQVGPDGMEGLHVAGFSCDGPQTITIETPDCTSGSMTILIWPCSPIRPKPVSPLQELPAYGTSVPACMMPARYSWKTT